MPSVTLRRVKGSLHTDRNFLRRIRMFPASSLNIAAAVVAVRQHAMPIADSERNPCRNAAFSICPSRINPLAGVFDA